MPVTINGTTGIVTPAENTSALTVGSITGILKATSGVVSQAVDGTDYLTSATLGSFPAAAKAWATYDGIANTLNKDYGVLSITRTNTGRYTVTFDSNFSDTNYRTVVGGIDNKLEVSSRTLSSLNLIQLAGATYNDSNYICIAIFA